MANMTEEERKKEEEKAAKIEVVMNISFYVTPEQFERIRVHLWTYIDYIKSDSVDDMFRAQTALSEILRIDPSNSEISTLLKELKDKIAIYYYEKKKKEQAEMLRRKLQKEAEEAERKKKEAEEAEEKAKAEAKKKEEEAEIARLEAEQKAKELAEAEEKARQDEELEKAAEDARIVAEEARRLADEAKQEEEIKKIVAEEVRRVDSIAIQKLELATKYEITVKNDDIVAQIEILEVMHEFDSKDREIENLLIDAKKELEIEQNVGNDALVVPNDTESIKEKLVSEDKAEERKATIKKEWLINYNALVKAAEKENSKSNIDRQIDCLKKALEQDSSDKEIIQKLSKLELESERKEFTLKEELEKEKLVEADITNNRTDIEPTPTKTIKKQQEGEEIKRYKEAIARKEITGKYVILRAEELHSAYGSDDTRLVLAEAFYSRGRNVIEEEIINSIVNKDEHIDAKAYTENKKEVSKQENKLVASLIQLTEYQANEKCEEAIVKGKIKGEEAIAMAEAVYNAYPTINSMINLIQALYVNGYAVTGRIIIDSNINMANERDVATLNELKTHCEERAKDGRWKDTSFVKSHMRGLDSKATGKPILAKKAEGTSINLEDNNEQ